MIAIQHVLLGIFLPGLDGSEPSTVLPIKFERKKTAITLVKLFLKSSIVSLVI